MTGPANLLDVPAASAALPVPANFGQRFMIWVDTEEEFDWYGPFDRNARDVTVIGGMSRFQKFISGAGVKPVYVTDHAVIDNDAACDLMREWIEAGSADIGAHLHPWVNPPHDEEVCLANSFAGNLPVELERAKLDALCRRISSRLNVVPRAFRAGRYGIGPESGRLLEEAGFCVDSSVRSRFDYRAQHGPGFMNHPLWPYRAGPTGSLIELPLSTAYVGWLGQMGDSLFPLCDGKSRMPGLLSRLGAITRIPLSPEGINIDQCKAAIDALIADNVPILSFSFHSPSLEPGHTPYCRTARDVEDFYHWWDSILEHLNRRNVTPLNLDGLIALR